MKNNNKKESLICCILHAISSFLFTFSGIAIIIDKEFKTWSGYAYIALGITFAIVAFMYFKRYKNQK